MKIKNEIKVRFLVDSRPLTRELERRIDEVMVRFGFVPGSFQFRETPSPDWALMASRSFLPSSAEIPDMPRSSLERVIGHYKNVGLLYMRDFRTQIADWDEEIWIPFRQTWAVIFGFDEPEQDCFRWITLATETSGFLYRWEREPDSFDFLIQMMVEEVAAALHVALESRVTEAKILCDLTDWEDRTLFLISPEKILTIADCDPEWVQPTVRLH